MGNPTGKPRTWRVRPVVVIDVNLEDWADTYGQTPEEALADCGPHLQAIVDHAVREELARVANGSTLVED